MSVQVPSEGLVPDAAGADAQTTSEVAGGATEPQGGVLPIVVAEPVPPTQIQHPWRATVRTVLSVLVGVVLTIPPAWLILADELAKQGITVPDSVQAVVGAVVGACVVLIGFVQRLILVPWVAGLVHRLGVGPTPKQK